MTRFIYLTDANDNTMAIVVTQVFGFSQNKPPTKTPTTVWLSGGHGFAVKNGFDECCERLMELTQE